MLYAPHKPHGSHVAEPTGAVESDHLPIQHRIRHDVRAQRCELLRPAQPGRLQGLPAIGASVSGRTASTIGVWKIPGASVTTRIPYAERSQA